MKGDLSEYHTYLDIIQHLTQSYDGKQYLLIY